LREVRTGVLLLPNAGVETSPGRRSVVRRFLGTWLGDANASFARLYAQLRELGWVGAHTVVVMVGDGAEWIWNRASMFVRRGEILDFWHAWEHAWGFAQRGYGEGAAPAGRWVHAIATDLRAGKGQEIIRRLKRVRPKNTGVVRELAMTMPDAYAMASICHGARDRQRRRGERPLNRPCMRAFAPPGCAGANREARRRPPPAVDLRLAMRHAPSCPVALRWKLPPPSVPVGKRRGAICWRCCGHWIEWI